MTRFQSAEYYLALFDPLSDSNHILSQYSDYISPKFHIQGNKKVFEKLFKKIIFGKFCQAAFSVITNELSFTLLFTNFVRKLQSSKEGHRPLPVKYPVFRRLEQKNGIAFVYVYMYLTKNPNKLYNVASALTVTGTVFMRRFRLFLGQCGGLTHTCPPLPIPVKYPVCCGVSLCLYL